MTEPYYSDNLVTLYLGDCREVQAWTEADVLITDPPYGVAHVSGWDKQKRKIAGDEDVRLRDEMLALWPVGKPAAVFGSWKRDRPAGVRNLVIWDKSGGVGSGMGDLKAAFGVSHEELYIFGRWLRGERKRHPSVIRTSDGIASLSKKVGHPTPKPLSLMRLIVEAAPAGVVADPFAGSGATLMAARELGRACIGVEFEERYCEGIAVRLEALASVPRLNGRIEEREAEAA